MPGLERPKVGHTTVELRPSQLRATLTAERSPGEPTNSLSSVLSGSVDDATATLDGRSVAVHAVERRAATLQVTL